MIETVPEAIGADELLRIGLSEALAVLIARILLFLVIGKVRVVPKSKRKFFLA